MAFFVERLAPTMAPLKASRLVGECDTVMREAELLSTLRAKIRRRDLVDFMYGRLPVKPATAASTKAAA